MVFTPSDAYIVLGHGQEPEMRPLKDEIQSKKFKAMVPTIGTIANNGMDDFDSAFIVPKNCIIVVKARPGEITYGKAIFRRLNKVGAAENQDLFRNPLSNTKDVVKRLGSVMIYKPGDKCPNYRYTFYNDVLDKFYPSHFGLLKTPLLTPLKQKEWNKDMEPDVPVGEYVHTLYNESVYPTPDLVLNTLVKAHNDSMKGTSEEGRPMLTSDIPWTDADRIINFLTITQKQLLQIGSDGEAKRPGVYYNFVCRGIPSKHEYYVNDTSDTSGKQVINPSIQSVIGQKKRTRKIIHRIIGEAETKRKYLIRNLYSGGKRTRTHKKRIG